MPTPPAATAVVAATIEDATVRELLHRPRTTAQRVISALESAGWTIAATRPANAPQTPTQPL